MEDELIAIDQLEDQLIDHPDAETRRELDFNSLDETFQKKLNERADEISRIDEADTGDATKGGLSFQFLITATNLNYTYKDVGSLQQEIADWFTYKDFELLGGLNSLAQQYYENVNLSKAKNNVEDQEITYITHCRNQLADWSFESDSHHTHQYLNALIYYSLGDYKNCNSAQEQVSNIRERSMNLFGLKMHETIVRMTKKTLSDERDERGHLDESLSFKLLTLLYMMVSAFSQLNDTPQYIELRQFLSETDILSDLVAFLEDWKLDPNTHLRARNVIQLVWKLILVEFGDSEHLKRCDGFLADLHGIQNKHGDSDNKLTCSPLDYFTFREDLVDKYPLFLKKKGAYDFKEFKKALDDHSDSSAKCSGSTIEDDYKLFMAINSESNSLSNFIANPRPNKAHSVFSQLPTQTVHIATPVPSPSSSPSDYMTGGEKVRKAYQVNQGIPFIYPQADELEVPYAIHEANEILQNCVYDSYSNKRLWHERQKFMIQERGFVSEYGNECKHDLDEFEYDEQSLLKAYPQNSMEIKTIMRIERFYENNLGRLNTFIEVLVEAINANKIDDNLCYTERELNNEGSFFSHDESVDPSKKSEVDELLLAQLEVLRAKEIIAKASSAIIVLLLKWFKVSHIIKYYFLTTILFDQQFFNVATEYLAASFNNSNIQDFNQDKDGDFERILYQNRLMNPKISIPQHDFFNNCLNKVPKHAKYSLINRTKINQLPSKIDDKRKSISIEKFNDDFFFILVNLMTIMNKIIIKNHTQRILTLNELKPSELFKMLATNYTNEYLNKPIFKILKKLIPYQGRKWKSINMDLISMIYLNCRLSMRDNWLSGKDLESDFNNSFDQEISLRGLIQFYNMRKYPENMEKLGYQISGDNTNYPIDDYFDYI